MKKIILIVLSLSLIATFGCSAKKIATDTIGKIATAGMASFENESDVEFARESAPALIKTMEVLRYGNKKNRDTLTLLAKAYGQYAFGFLEEDMLKYKRGSKEYIKARERAELFYRRGKEHGIAALIGNSGMKKGFKGPFPEFKRALQGLGKKYVPALFWTAFNWANWLNLKADDPMAIVDLPRIEAVVNRVLELDGTFCYGSAHALIATILSSRPKMLGGNPELAGKEFNEAISIEPNYLMTKVLYSQYYARRINDENLFETTLNEVITADLALLQSQMLANKLAKRRAQILLNMKKGLF
ncbi:MAG: hypothetical protein HN337_03470 [Deltaproteobacteria bacterium]|jgi:hypothetical protein|nr:hypothetical protein [Deltaproteobacteria bacterium]